MTWVVLHWELDIPKPVKTFAERAEAVIFVESRYLARREWVRGRFYGEYEIAEDVSAQKFPD
jgi:hypothetical protein